MKYLLEAIYLNPNALINYLFPGDALWELDNKEEAKKERLHALRISAEPQGVAFKIININYRNMISKRLYFADK